MSSFAAQSSQSTRWSVIISAVRGAAHESSGAPMQDAAGYGGNPDTGVFVAAVADGHGHPRHFRSDRGSNFAMKVAVSEAREFAMRIDGLHDKNPGNQSSAVERLARSILVPEIVQRWHSEVNVDLTERPFSEKERRRAGGDVPVFAYGTTLLMALVAGSTLALCQIGDGDIIVIRPDGAVDRPVPDDPSNDGRFTSSMCQLNAVEAFRCTVLDLSDCPVAGVFLATDGFGNAQVADPWYPAVGRDLLAFSQAHGVTWMRAQMPVWAARCASSEGSGDDVALALLLARAEDSKAEGLC